MSSHRNLYRGADKAPSDFWCYDSPGVLGDGNADGADGCDGDGDSNGNGDGNGDGGSDNSTGEGDGWGDGDGRDGGFGGTTATGVGGAGFAVFNTHPVFFFQILYPNAPHMSPFWTCWGMRQRWNRG